MATLKRAGTAVFTNGWATVTGVGTLFSTIPDGATVRKRKATGTPEAFYGKASHTDDTHMTLDTPYGGTTSDSGGDEFDAVVFQQGTLADAVNLFSQLNERIQQSLQLTAHDRTLILSKDADTDNAGVILQATDIDKFRWGTFGDNDFVLQRKSGVSWVTVFTADETTGVLTFSEGAITSAANPRNRINNGSMRLSRTNGTSTVDVNGATTEVVDNWYVQTAGGGVIRAQQIAGPSPSGSPFWEKLLVQTADASVAAGDLYRFYQALNGIEVADLQWGTAAAKQLTVGLALNLPAGTYGVSVHNAAGNRSYVKEIVISGPEGGTDVTKSVTFPGDTTGTWLTTDTDAIFLVLDLGSGSNFTATANIWSAGLYTRTASQFNWIGTGATIAKIGDVAAYAGATAPTYELPSYSEAKRRVGEFTRMVVTAAMALALAVGPNGATNPAFSVDTSVASAATGVGVQGRAAAAGASIYVTSSGTNENLTIDAKGSGTITINGTGTGAISLARATSVTGTFAASGAISTTDATVSSSTTTGSGKFAGGVGIVGALNVGGATVHTGATTLSAALTYGGVTLSNAVTGTGNMVLSASPTFTGTLTAAIGAFSDSVTISKTQNAATKLTITNTNATANTNTYASLQLDNGDGTTQRGLYVPGTAYTGYEGFAAGVLALYTASAAGISLITDAAGPISFWTNGTARLNISSAGDLAFNTNKFTVASATGNTVVAGTLGVTGNTTITANLAVAGATVGTTYALAAGDGTGSKYLRINGGNTNSGDGALFTIATGGTDRFYFGNRSAFAGGAYDANFAIISAANNIRLYPAQALVLDASSTVVNFPLTTASSSTTTGCVTFAGGIGVAGAAYIGGATNIGGTLGVSGKTTISASAITQALDFGTSSANQKIIIGLYTNGNTWGGIGMAPGDIGIRLAGDSGGSLIDAGYYSADGSHTWTSKFIVSGSGVVTVASLATGSLTSVSGVITSSSDARLKNRLSAFTRSVIDLRKIGGADNYEWNGTNDLHGLGTGWMLRAGEGLALAIPEAVHAGPDGMLSLSDRPILATCVNAIIDHDDEIKHLTAEVTALRSEVATLKEGHA
jgi:hypothetical protein